MHRTRAEAIDQLRALAAHGRWEDLYRRHVFFEFPHEARMGFQLAFMRPFCDPSMAAILVEAGRIEANAKVRAYDTGIVIHEIIADGIEGPRAQRMIAHMNRQHTHFPQITPEQMTYVLACFSVIPTRYIERAGWRDVLDIEKDASRRFYDRLGEQMGIATRPVSYADAERIVDEYEAQHLRPDASTLALGRASVEVISNRLPKPVRPLAGQLFASQIADETVAHAVGLPRVHPLAIAASTAIAAVRRVVVPRTPAPTAPIFTPGQPSGPYVDGYTLPDIEKP